MTADPENLGPEPTPGAQPGPHASAADEAEAVQVEGAQSELDLGVLSTGSASVDHALAPLEGLAERQVSGHAEVFEQVLDELAQTMTGPDPHQLHDRDQPAERAEPGVPSASD